MSDPNPFEGIIEEGIAAQQRSVAMREQAKRAQEDERERNRVRAYEIRKFRERGLGGTPPEFVFGDDEARLCYNFLAAMKQCGDLGLEPPDGVHTERRRQFGLRRGFIPTFLHTEVKTTVPVRKIGYPIGHSAARYESVVNSVTGVGVSWERDVFLCKDGLLRGLSGDLALATDGTVVRPRIGNFETVGSVDKVSIGTSGRSDNPVYREVDNRKVTYRSQSIENALTEIAERVSLAFATGTQVVPAQFAADEAAFNRRFGNIPKS